MDIASFVRKKRRDLELTLEQLAQMAGVGIRPIFDLESHNPVPLDSTIKVLKALGYELTITPKRESRRPGGVVSRRPPPLLPWDD